VTVRWLDGAQDDLHQIYKYISEHNPTAAVSVVQTIVEKGHMLSEFPDLGKVGRVAGTRELILSGVPYILPYQVIEGKIEILRVLHTSRKFPS